MFENSANIQGQNAQSLSVLTSATVTGSPLLPGTYAVWSNVDTYIKTEQLSANAVAVTTTTGLKLQRIVR